MSRSRGTQRRALTERVRAHRAVQRRFERVLENPKHSGERLGSLVDEVVRVTLLELAAQPTEPEAAR